MAFTDFFCIGFQKCGTSTLYELLNKHPEVVLCQDVKEPMYYRVRGLRPVFGKGFYEHRYFGHVPEGDTRLKGEVNAGLTYTTCADKIGKDFGPDAKLIFMMREPVSRSYSAYKYFLARGFLTKNDYETDAKYGHAKGFDIYAHKILDNTRRRAKIMKKRLKYLVFSQSQYAQCIREYLAYFPKENMKFILFEDFTKDQHKSCREIYDFIGIDDNNDVPYGLHVNEYNGKAVSANWATGLLLMKGINYLLYEFLWFKKRFPKLYDAFHKKFLYVREHSMEPDNDKDPVLPETRKYLNAYYEPMVRDLEEITGFDLKEVWGI